MGLIDDEIIKPKFVEKTSIVGRLLLIVRDGYEESVQTSLRISTTAREMILEFVLEDFSFRHGPMVLDDLHVGSKGFKFPHPIGKDRDRNDNDMRRMVVGD